jgi:drug/metabolite transporter superfamily protein YnfA
MLRVLILLDLLLSTYTSIVAQDSSGVRISIITCGVGQDLYSIYGHSAVRLIDSLHQTDVVYNYGTFNFGDPDFYIKFTRGKLPYYLNLESYSDFMSIYAEEGRSVYEQVLDLSPSDEKKMIDFLATNLKPENKYYRYDFLFDNCSTRIRDIFSKEYGKRFQYGSAMKDDSISFRTLLNYYERNLHWERFGINLLMSHQVDWKMTNEQSMFLPDYLMKGLRNTSLDGKPLIKETLQLLPEPSFVKDIPNQPRIVCWILFVVILLLSFIPMMKTPLLFFDVFLFMVLGLLGCLMLFMWFGTEHKVCAWNRNLLWAFPLHLVFAFLIPRKSEMAAKYARYASILIVISLLYNLFAEQKYIVEITPIILLIIFRLNSYTTKYKLSSFNQFIR